MELKKERYSLKEVSKILSERENEYNQQFSEQRYKIEQLSLDNKKLTAALNEYEKKEDYISNALINAEKQAEDIVNKAKIQYSLTVEKLRTFYFKWNNYFSKLIEKYPHYDEVNKAKSLMDKLKGLLGEKEDGQALVGELDVVTPSNNNDDKFDPQKKINEYVAATSTNGFNLDEVLNPGELELEDICKELGLIDEE